MLLLRAQLAVFLDGLYGLPLRLPGSPLARALAAKEVLLEVLGRELEGAYKEFTDKVRVHAKAGQQHDRACVLLHGATVPSMLVASKGAYL